MGDQTKPANTAVDNPAAAVRRADGPARPRRFYDNVSVEKTADGHAVRLDARPVHTPARKILAAPNGRLAAALAAEWAAQGEVVDPASMPLTRLANAIIDAVAARPAPVAADIAAYLSCDLLFYRAGSPRALVERQSRHWDPILDWAADTLGARFVCTEGVVFVAQPPAALAAATAAICGDAWRLGALSAATTLTGSALIALALARRALPVEAAWAAANVDEDWNMEQWGRDALALQRRSLRRAELGAAALVLEVGTGSDEKPPAG